MKKIIYLFLIMALFVFVGCSKDSESSSLTINNVNIVGTWALIADIGDVHDDPNEILTMWKDGGKIEDLVVITSNQTLRLYIPTDYWYDKWLGEEYPFVDGFVFSKGYLHGCSMSDFVEDGEAKFSIENGRVYMAGFYLDLRFEGKDIVTLYNENIPDQRYKRVLGFK